MELYTFFGGNNGEYVDYNGNTRSIKPGTAHLLEHYICENTVEGNLLDNLRKYNILSCNGVLIMRILHISLVLLLIFMNV